MDEDVAAIMITNPNTLGIFESHIAEIAEIVHAKGGLVYGDGANMNALLGVARPGDMGVRRHAVQPAQDVRDAARRRRPRLRPGRGEGAPRAVPPAARRREGGRRATGSSSTRRSARRPSASSASSGATSGCSSAPGRSSASTGPRASRRPGKLAVLNANYLRALLASTYNLPYETDSLHEVVFDDKLQKAHGVTTMDVAKRLIDHGFHPPTVYFPLVVTGALMIEPTETESKETLERFVAAMKAIAEEAQTDPDAVKAAPDAAVPRAPRRDARGAQARPALAPRDEGRVDRGGPQASGLRRDVFEIGSLRPEA